MYKKESAQSKKKIDLHQQTIEELRKRRISTSKEIRDKSCKNPASNKPNITPRRNSKPYAETAKLG
jgi:hypothetical protein